MEPYSWLWPGGKCEEGLGIDGKQNNGSVFRQKNGKQLLGIKDTASLMEGNHSITGAK